MSVCNAESSTNYLINIITLFYGNIEHPHRSFNFIQSKASKHSMLTLFTFMSISKAFQIIYIFISFLKTNEMTFISLSARQYYFCQAIMSDYSNILIIISWTMSFIIWKLLMGKFMAIIQALSFCLYHYTRLFILTILNCIYILKNVLFVLPECLRCLT